MSAQKEPDTVNEALIVHVMESLKMFRHPNDCLEDYLFNRLGAHEFYQTARGISKSVDSLRIPKEKRDKLQLHAKQLVKAVKQFDLALEDIDASVKSIAAELTPLTQVNVKDSAAAAASQK